MCTVNPYKRRDSKEQERETVRCEMCSTKKKILKHRREEDIRRGKITLCSQFTKRKETGRGERRSSKMRDNTQGEKRHR